MGAHGVQRFLGRKAGLMMAEWRKLGRMLMVVLVCGACAVPVRADDENEGSAALECVGGLSVAHSHTSLALIGVTADAFAKGVYEPDTVAELMGSLIGGIDANKKMLRKLQATDELSDEDEAYVDSVLGLYNALEVEAKALIKFSKSKADADAMAFEKARLAAVAKLNKLIGDEEEE